MYYGKAQALCIASTSSGKMLLSGSEKIELWELCLTIISLPD